MAPWVEAGLLRYRIQWALVGAMALAVLGTVLVTSAHGTGFRINWGDGLVLIAAMLRAAQMTLTKRWVPLGEMDTVALNSIQFLTVFIICALISMTCVTGGSHGAPLHSPLFWWVAGYLGIMGTVFAFVVQMVSIQHTSPARAALLLGLEPAFSTIFAVLGGESLSAGVGIGGTLIIVGTMWGRHVEQTRREQLGKMDLSQN